MPGGYDADLGVPEQDRPLRGDGPSRGGGAMNSKERALSYDDARCGFRTGIHPKETNKALTRWLEGREPQKKKLTEKKEKNEQLD